jgi:uncharacterized alpha/beta hydrolase family protein
MDKHIVDNIDKIILAVFFMIVAFGLYSMVKGFYCWVDDPFAKKSYPPVKKLFFLEDPFRVKTVLASDASNKFAAF